MVDELGRRFWKVNMEVKHMMQFKIKLSLIKQKLNADVNIYWLATSPPKLMIFGFFEVIKCNSEAPSASIFFIIVNDEN